MKEEEIKSMVDDLIEALTMGKVEKLTGFDKAIDEIIKASNLPLDFSFACAYVVGQKMLLKTIGEGEVFIKRGNRTVRLINGNNIAAGLLQANDIFFLTTTDFVDAIGEDKLNAILRVNTDESQLGISQEIRNHDNKIAILISFSNEDQEPFHQKRCLFDGVVKRFESYKAYGRGKKNTLILVGIIGLLFIWSVGLGYKRRIDSSLQEKIQEAKELIVQKTDQAEEVALINLPRAQILLGEAKDKLIQLKNEVKNNKQKEIEELSRIISQQEAKIIKKEEKNYEEFFDLTIDNKNATGNLLYLDSDNLLILDKKGSTIFSLSLEKKSLTKQIFPEIKDARLIAGYQGSVFFLTNAGIFKINQDGKLKKEINTDKDWGNIAGMNVFNGNIYLLDKGKDEIFKYIAGDSGYSEKNSYFKAGQSVSLADTNSFTIDSSLYIGFRDYIFKFTSGLRDGFKTTYPDESVNLVKIFTDKNFEQILAWDKSKGTIYILDKDGAYDKQISSKMILSGTDFVAFDNSVYVLSGPKIYKIGL